MENANSKANHNNLNNKPIKELENKIKNNSASNNFFLKTNEDSLNLNDNAGEKYIKSIISSDSLIDEMANMKNHNGNIPVNNDVFSSSNMFSEDSFNKALMENNLINNFIPPKNQMNGNNNSKNNFNLNLNQKENIPVLNVEVAKNQLLKVESKSILNFLISAYFFIC